MNALRIATWNVNSINARLPLIELWVKDAQPDVLCLQEIKCIDEKFPSETFESLGYNLAVHGQKTYNGVAILSKFPLSDIHKGLDGSDDDPQARYIEAVVQCPMPVRVASIYLPNGNPIGTEKYDYKLKWLDRLYAKAKAIMALEESSVLCGDFNIIPFKADCHKESLWLGDALYQPEVRAAFQGLKNLGFTDAFDALTPPDNRYTFWDYQAGAWPKNEGIRIDHHLLSPQMLDRLNRFEIYKSTRGETHENAKPSDHVPVMISVKA